MSEAGLHAVTADLAALQAVVRALARCHARRSRSALTDLLDSLQIELGRLEEMSSFPGYDPASSGMVEAWIEEIKAEAMGYGGADTAEPHPHSGLT